MDSTPEFQPKVNQEVPPHKTPETEGGSHVEPKSELAPEHPYQIEKLISNVPPILLEPSGTYKYIQISCDLLANSERIYLVRGKNLKYHKNIFMEFKN